MAVSDLKVIEPFSTSDHDSIAFMIQLHIPWSDNSDTSVVNSVFYSWSMTVWEAFYSYCVNTNWLVLFRDCKSANELWDCFASIILVGIENCVPQKPAIKSHKLKIQHPKVIHRLIIKKKGLWKKCKNSEHIDDRKNYNDCARHLKSAMRTIELLKERDIIRSADKNKLYKYLRNNRSHTSDGVPLKNVSGDLLTSPEDIANELNTTFIEMGTTDNGLLPFIDKCSIKTDDLNLVYFDELDVFNECAKLKPKFSLGPDNIPAILYKKLGNCLSQPLAIIFNLIMQYGVLPDI